MNKATHLLLTLLSVLLFCSAAMADKVTLKNGKVYEGTVLEQNADMVMIRIKVGTIEQTLTFWADSVEKVEMDSAGVSDPVGGEAQASTTTTGGASASSTTPATTEKRENVTRVAVIPASGEVGPRLRADKLKAAVDALRPYEPDVIVLVIDSPGGYLSELYKISEYISEIRDEFRVVSWVKTAISAAAMTALNTKEIYFMREGNMGAAVAWYSSGGQAVSMSGPEFEAWRQGAMRMAEAAGHDGAIALSMVDAKVGLSATKEYKPNGDYEVIWFSDDESGEHVLAKEGEVLTLTANEAVEYKFALGIADNVDELAQQLGLEEWEEVSDVGRNLITEWNALIDKAEKDIPRLYQTLNLNESLMGGGGERERSRLLGEQIRIVTELIALARALGEDAAAMMGLDKRQLERLLEQLKRQKG